MTTIFCINVRSKTIAARNLVIFSSSQHLVEVVSKEVVTSSLLPVLVDLTNDPVANVRFNVCKAFIKMCNKTKCYLDTRYIGKPLYIFLTS